MPRVVTRPASFSSSSVKPRSLRLLGQPLARREPEPELLRDLLAEPAAGEVLAHGRTGIPVPQQALEVRRRLVEHRVQALAPLPLRLDLR